METAGVSSNFDDCFNELFALAIKPAWRLLGDRDEAENIAAEVLARALVRWTVLSDSPNLPGWIVTVSTNLSIAHLRKAKRWSPLLSLVGTNNSHKQATIDERLDIDEALLGISKRQRDALVMRYYLDYSEAEIAGTLGISVSSVKTHIHRGLQGLRLLLADRSEPRVARD
jgi:RNA polymerase sigma factor (sigma-70 family)